MNPLLDWLRACAFSVGALFAVQAWAQNVEPLALTNANVVSTIDGSVEPGATVLIADRKIARVIKAGSGEVLPAGTRIHDLAGRYVIPGLWDMHVHAFLEEHDPDWMFPLMLAHGVTGLRDMGSLMTLPKMRRVREEIERGTRLGPRVVLSGPIIDTVVADWLSPAGVPTLTEALSAVRHAKVQGADFFKIYPLISRDAYFAIVEEARRIGLPIAGQVPESVTVAEASNAGQRSIEHLEKILLGCSGAEAQVVAARRAELARARSMDALLDYLSKSTFEIIERLSKIDEASCQRLIALLVRNRTAVIPTLVGVRTYMREARRVDDPRLAALPLAIKETWLAMDVALRAAPNRQAVAATTLARQAERLVRPLAVGGVAVLAGTQTAAITPFVFPGSSLHDELIALEAAGLTDLQALQAATIAPARFFGRETEMGTVAPGRFADLVVLDGNPARDIRRVRDLYAVIIHGKLIERAELLALGNAEARAR